MCEERRDEARGGAPARQRAAEQGPRPPPSPSHQPPAAPSAHAPAESQAMLVKSSEEKSVMTQVAKYFDRIQ